MVLSHDRFFLEAHGLAIEPTEGERPVAQVGSAVQTASVLFGPIPGNE